MTDEGKRKDPQMRFYSVAMAMSALALAACADDLKADEDDGILGGGDGKAVTARNEDGTYTTRLDAFAIDTWTNFDFDLGIESIEPDDTWDVAVQRFHLKLHPGEGPSAVQVKALGDVPLARVEGDESGTWLIDEPDGDDENTNPDYAFEQGDGWYSYSPMTHVLTPYPKTWLLRTGEGALRAIRIESYYDAAGTSGQFTLRWKPIRSSVTQVAAAQNGGSL